MTAITEIIFSGFVSKTVNDIVDISKGEIRKAVKNKNAKHQNIESQIYNVIVGVLNRIANYQCKNVQDTIYDSAEVLLQSFKKNKENLLSIKSCLCSLGLCSDENKCLEFKVSLCEELGREEYGELFSAILLSLLDQKNQYDCAIYKQLNHKLDEVNIKIDKLDKKMDDIYKEQDDTNIQEQVCKFQNNKKQKYIENWNSRLFLHADDDTNFITLKDVFIVPNFEYYIKAGSIKFSDRDLLTEAIEKFIQYDKASNLLITGAPGIGKTSIISWIADKYKDNEDIIILRFRDWSNQDLAGGLLNAICNSLDCGSVDLENKVLIIDGFDEIKSVNERKSLIRDFFNVTLDYENLKIVITSRPDYLDTYYFKNAFIILPFDIFQIKQFYQTIKYIDLDQGKIDKENIDILGIPVILYMAIMTNIDLTLKTTKPELYNQIFAEKGGIFDRFCFKGIGYDSGFQPLRDEDNVKKYLHFLQEVAFSMFKNNNLVLTEKEYDMPELIFQGEKLSVIEFPIKPFFESDGHNIEFIHKSIYEYFVSEYFYRLFTQNIYINMTNIKLAGIFGQILKDNILSLEIVEYLKFKVRDSILSKKIELIESTFRLMIQDGMTYHTGICYKNIVECEKRIFSNMLKIVYIWDEKYIIKLKCNVLNLIYNNNNLETINLSFEKLDGIVLKELNLSKAKLCGIQISNSVLTGIKLCEANLERAKFENIILCNANLTGAVLKRAELKKVYLTNAELRNADFRQVTLEDTIIYGSNINNSIWHIDDIRKIYSQLYSTEFEYIVITSVKNRKIVSRNVFFSKNIDELIQWLRDELRI